ncbi:MAG: Fur family transcriptional regulator [Cytophagales bacterium CG18_big_fil_WC_8_21_14_2_50_42_9]|nr:MAG: Fur family transcriptional regulator [Cytophagales bacterium CG18_big_fil_WC_8_21_14_2_50_42_9]
MNDTNRDKDLTQLLQQHNLKVTGPRLSILNILAARDIGTSQPDLENILKPEVDRVTLYRALKTFTDKGIIHKVFDTHGTATYALCSDSCTEHQHHDEHLHFNCTVCNQVYCLNDIQFPEIKLPTGFTSDFMTFTAAGICNRCHKE